LVRFEFFSDISAALKSKKESHPSPVLKIEAKDIAQPTIPASKAEQLTITLFDIFEILDSICKTSSVLSICD
jgi:hypothetical protein